MLQQLPSNITHKAVVFFIVESAHRCGMFPITMRQLHPVMYFANTMSPIFNFDAIYKETYDPSTLQCFPAIATHIAALINEGVIEETSFGSVKSGYGVTKQGFSFVEREYDTHEHTLIRNYLREVIFSLTNHDDLLDIMYERDPHRVLDDLSFIDGHHNSGNVSVEIAHKCYPKNRVKTTRESVHRYTEYVKRLTV